MFPRARGLRLIELASTLPFMLHFSFRSCVCAQAEGGKRWAEDVHWPTHRAPAPCHPSPPPHERMSLHPLLPLHRCPARAPPSHLHVPLHHFQLEPQHFGEGGHQLAAVGRLADPQPCTEHTHTHTHTHRSLAGDATFTCRPQRSKRVWGAKQNLMPLRPIVGHSAAHLPACLGTHPPQSRAPLPPAVARALA